MSAAALDTLRKVKGVEKRPDFRAAMNKLQNSTNPRLKLIATSVLKGKNLSEALRDVQPGSVLDFRYFVTKIEPILAKPGRDGKACVFCHASHVIFKLEPPNAEGVFSDQDSEENYKYAMRVVDINDPDKSLILIKPTRPTDSAGNVGDYLATHNGGQRWHGNESSEQYRTILEWIRGGRLEAANKREVKLGAPPSPARAREQVKVGDRRRRNPRISRCYNRKGVHRPNLIREQAARSMTLRLFNTLSGQMDELVPADGKALRMYACGPTVYDYGHIGNFRTFLQIDVLRRFLSSPACKVRHVMNITDVDDKIIRNAAAAGIPIGEYTPKYVEAFFEDLDALRVERPGADRPRHRAHSADGRAGPEAGRRRRGLQDGRRKLVLPPGRLSRVRQAEQEGPERHGRRRARGCGRVREGLGPRLCAVEGGQARRDIVGYAHRPRPPRLAHRVLGHGDGVPGRQLRPARRRRRPDVPAPRKRDRAERERDPQALRAPLDARALSARRRRKMSKSEGNFYTLRDLLLKGYKASAIRLALISVPYRHQLNFTFDSLIEATAPSTACGRFISASGRDRSRRREATTFKRPRRRRRRNTWRRWPTT